MKTKKLTLFLFVFLLATLASLGQDLLNQNLEQEFDRLLGERYKPGQPGGVALVAKDGQVIYRKAFGMANLELDVPMKPEMVFRIGSVTKQFTAVAILQLLEQGKLSLDDEITRFIPDYPTQGQKITIHHLLNHTSGIKSYTSMPEFRTERRFDRTPAQIIDFFKDQPMDFAPGERYLYNNSGYILLGYIIEKISGLSYEEYLNEHLFKPAGMLNSLFGNDIILLKNRAYGYQPFNDGFANAEFMSMTQPYAAGSLMSTVDDLLKWNIALQSEKLLKRETLQKAFTSGKLNDGSPITYGYGWDMGTLQGSPIIAHGGGINGYLSYAGWLPQENVVVVVLQNVTGQSPDDIGQQLAALAIGKPVELKEIQLPEEILKRYLGKYEIMPGFVLTITLEDGKLMAQATGQPKFELFAESETKFFLKVTVASVEFLTDDSGEVNALMLRQGGQQIRAPRLD